MKKFYLLIVLFQITILAQGQEQKGKIVVDHLYSPALENDVGENPTRRVTIYLPPGYEESNIKYPVLYYLHAGTRNDSLTIAEDHLDKLLDKAIASGKIKPVIVVISDQYTLYRIGMYTNSSLTGNWSDFTSMDLVAYVDQNYRSIKDKDSRGIAGHSGGGHGAVKLGMLFPDVFSCVYALSPAGLVLGGEWGPKSSWYQQAQQIKTREALINGPNNFGANVVIAIGREYSPNPNKPPFYTDLPFTYIGDSLIINHKILELWKKNTPIDMVDDYLDNLKQLKALKLDWGRNDPFENVLLAKKFSEKLEDLGINHYAEEYIGDHGNKLYTDDGRVLNDLLPFFNTYLKFE
jgi:S-formylglutathione hydrolase FrmB